MTTATAANTTPGLRRVQPITENFASPMTTPLQGESEWGMLYTALNATVGTAVNYVVQTTFSATVAALSIRNGGTAGNPSVRPRYIRLIVGTAPASGTAGHWAITLDNPASARDSSGTVLTANNTTLDATRTQAATAVVNWTPTVAAASTAAFTLARGLLHNAIPVVNDEYIFVFGADGMPGTISDFAGTTAKRIVIPAPPCTLTSSGNGNQTMFLHLWFPSNASTAPAFEFEVCWAER